MNWTDIAIVAVLLAIISVLVAKIIAWHGDRDWRISRYELDAGQAECVHEQERRSWPFREPQ